VCLRPIHHLISEVGGGEMHCQPLKTSVAAGAVASPNAWRSIAPHAGLA